MEMLFCEEKLIDKLNVCSKKSILLTLDVSLSLDNAT